MSLHQSSGRWRLGFSLALATTLLWGVLPIALKIVLQALDVYTLIWFRFLVAFGLLLLVLGLQRSLPSWRQLWEARLELLAIATLGLASNYLLYSEGLHQTSPTNSQVIIQLAPVFFSLGAIALFKERYTLLQWVGLGGLTAGLLMFFKDQLQVLLTASGPYLVGSGLLVLAAVVWAFYALAQKQLLTRLTSMQIMLVLYGGSALLFTPTVSLQPLTQLTWLQWGMLLFSAFNTLLAYGAFAEALDHWEASRVSAVLSLTPLVTLLSVFAVAHVFPSWLQAERITAMGLSGAVLVVAGSLAIALGKSSTISTRAIARSSEV